MLKTAAVLFCFISALSAQSQEASQQYNTQTPLNARYEILLLANNGWTFRLDKFTGKVSTLVETRDETRWKEMEVIDLPPAAQEQPRFQLSNWMHGTYSFYLLDTFTGLTWRLITDPRGPSVWKPFKP